MDHTSILIADDELAVRVTLEAILKRQGFEVTVAASVQEALHAMSSQKFDALISDLNIGEPADGFTLISAMRRQQPNAVTILITGFPDFEAALEAIRNQVDEYLIKPAEPATLVSKLQELMKSRNHVHTTRAMKRAADLIRESLLSIIDNWVQRVRQSPELAQLAELTVPRAQLVAPVIAKLAELVVMLGFPSTEESYDVSAAFSLGAIRTWQGYTPEMLAEEARLLENSIFDCLEANLLRLNTSYLIHDIVDITDRSQIQLKASLKGASAFASNTWKAA